MLGRGKLIAAAIAALVGCGLTAGTGEASTAYQQDAAHTGYAPYSLGTLTPRWERDFGTDVIGYPLVAVVRVRR